MQVASRAVASGDIRNGRGRTTRMMEAMQASYETTFDTEALEAVMNEWRNVGRLGKHEESLLSTTSVYLSAETVAI